MSVTTRHQRLTAQQLLAKKRAGEKIVSLTAYDYSTAKIIDQTGQVDFILVGDSLGMVVLGYPDTLSVTMDDMLHHVKAVSRGVEKAMVVADMPFMSVSTDPTLSIKNVTRMMQEGRANAVKIEGASEMAIDIIMHLTRSGIPVMGHIGFTPQSLNQLGGFKVQGKSLEAVEKLVEDARALEAAGVFAIVLEMVPQEVAAMITRMVEVPTIGIGAGVGCDGQILVIDDMMGKFPDFTPKFVRRYMETASLLTDATRQYAADVLSGDFPHAERESFNFPEDMISELQDLEVELENAQPQEAHHHHACC